MKNTIKTDNKVEKREKLFSVTADDCKWDYFKGSGNGGQKRNKTASGVRCTHIISGAVGCAEDSRSQIDNKTSAFKRMAETNKFQTWLKMEIARRKGILDEIDRQVERDMLPRNIKIEAQTETGWKEINEKEIIEENNESENGSKE